VFVKSAEVMKRQKTRFVLQDMARKSIKFTCQKFKRHALPDKTGHDSTNSRGSTSDDADTMVVMQTIKQQRMCTLTHSLQHTSVSQNPLTRNQLQRWQAHLHIFENVVELVKRMRLSGYRPGSHSAVVLDTASQPKG
jgi:hypothetical protein